MPFGVLWTVALLLPMGHGRGPNPYHVLHSQGFPQRHCIAECPGRLINCLTIWRLL